MFTAKDCCEPPIEPSFKEYELDGYPILAIEISMGQDRPYMMKNRGRSRQSPLSAGLRLALELLLELLELN